jgi:hypothetical protein
MSGVGHLGLIALFVLTLQNSFKSIFMRFIMKDQPEFLLSTAIVTVEVLKLVLCLLYIQFVEMKPLESIGAFLRQGIIIILISIFDCNLIILDVLFTQLTICFFDCLRTSILQASHCPRFLLYSSNVNGMCVLFELIILYSYTDIFTL